MFQEKESEWSEEVKFTPDFSECCAWKECPEYVDVYGKYSVDEKNSRIVTKINDHLCTITGNTSLPHNKVASWSIKILESRDSDGETFSLELHLLT